MPAALPFPCIILLKIILEMTERGPKLFPHPVAGPRWDPYSKGLARVPRLTFR